MTTTNLTFKGRYDDLYNTNSIKIAITVIYNHFDGEGVEVKNATIRVYSALTSNAEISVENIIFRNCTLNIENVKFSNCTFYGCTFFGTRSRFCNCDFFGVVFNIPKEDHYIEIDNSVLRHAGLEYNIDEKLLAVLKQEVLCYNNSIKIYRDIVVSGVGRSNHYDSIRAYKKCFRTSIT